MSTVPEWDHGSKPPVPQLPEKAPILYLHIGAQKTGTTSIQSALHTRREELKRSGVLYPAGKHHICHHRIAYGLRRCTDPVTGDVPDFFKELEATKDEIRSNDVSKIILSTESFFTLPKPSIRLLRQTLDGFDVKIIAYIRRQDEMLMAIYNQLVKTPWTEFRKSFPEMCHELRKIPQLNYRRYLNRWSSVFNRSDIILRCYENVGDVVVDFHSLCGIPVSVPNSGKRWSLNRRVSNETVLVMRLVKSLVKDEAKRRIILQLSRRWLNWNLFALMTDEDRRRVLEVFKEDNRAVFETYMNTVNYYDPDILFGPAGK